MGEPGHLGTEERRLSAASDDDDPLLRDRSDHRMAGIPPGEPAGLEDDAVDGVEGAEALRAVAVQAWGTRSAEGDPGTVDPSSSRLHWAGNTSGAAHQSL